MPGFYFKTSYGRADFNAEFPHQVAFRRASAGAIELMDNYCSARSIPFRKREDMRGHLRYCFARSAQANQFAVEFGGERINVVAR